MAYERFDDKSDIYMYTCCHSTGKIVYQIHVSDRRNKGLQVERDIHFTNLRDAFVYLLDLRKLKFKVTKDLLGRLVYEVLNPESPYGEWNALKKYKKDEYIKEIGTMRRLFRL